MNNNCKLIDFSNTLFRNNDITKEYIKNYTYSHLILQLKAFKEKYPEEFKKISDKINNLNNR